MTSKKFVPALELSGSFYRDVVSGLIRDVPHSAAHLGEGSEVLGFDTERSTDHGWGIRLQVFVDEKDIKPVKESIETGLPAEYRGYPVRYFRWETDRVESHIEVADLRSWITRLLGFDPRGGVSIAQWLALPQQLLVEVTRGAVFRDDSGELSRVRQILEWYPTDVWLWCMACHWSSVGSIASFVGRTAELGDEIGSRLAAMKITRTLMRLALLQDRTYAPYDKWLGTAFARMHDGAELSSLATNVLEAETYPPRERGLINLTQKIGDRHNALRVTERVEASVENVDVGVAGAIRPYRVVNASPFVQACLAPVENARLRGMNLVGAIDQLMDVSDTLIHFTDWPRQIMQVYEHTLDRP